MLKFNLEKDYSNSEGMDVEVLALPDNKVRIGMGEGIENIELTVSDNQAETLTKDLLRYLRIDNVYNIIENFIETIDNDDIALKLTERLIKNVYGERTLEEAENTISSLETQLEMAEEKIDQLEEYHGIRF